jgi:MerR family transcriptional regulator, copper efflux regulator
MNAAALAWPVNIGMASRMSGVTPKMIRHYETLGLVPAVGRTDSGYRQYSEADIHTLRFIKRSRELGFPIADIGELVSLWRNRRRASSSVKRIAQQHAQELAQRIQAMQAMQRTLDQLIYCCQGDERPGCPILDDLAGLHDGVHA